MLAHSLRQSCNQDHFRRDTFAISQLLSLDYSRAWFCPLALAICHDGLHDTMSTESLMRYSLHLERYLLSYHVFMP